MFFSLWGAVLGSGSLNAILTVVEKQKVSAVDIKKYTQENWIRRPHQERADMSENDRYIKCKDFIMHHLTKMGMINAVMPQKSHYDYVIIHGALMDTMQERIDFFKKIRPFVTYKQIVFLSGKRMLDPVKEKLAIECGLKTEAEGAGYLMLKNGFPNAVIVDAVKFKGVRPNTQDTVDAWLETKPMPGKILAISNNPYVQRQDLILRHSVGKDFELDTVGSKAKNGTLLAVFFDELARLIYAELTVENT